MTTPLVSVVIPCFNNADYLGPAIESVYEQGIDQTEVIVVDDGSTDGSAEVAFGYDGVRVLRQPNLGSGPARDRGIAAARGTYIALLDADDIWAPGKLQAQLGALDADPELDLVYAHIEEFVTDELSTEERAGLVARPGRPAVLLPSTVLMARDRWDRVGGFEAGTGASESIDWVLRVRERGLNATAADGALVYRRIHSSNTSRRQKEIQRITYLQAIKRSLDRRRSAEGQRS